MSGVYSSDAPEEPIRQRSSPRPSAEQRERTAPRRRLNYDVYLTHIFHFTPIKSITATKVSDLCVSLQVAEREGGKQPEANSQNLSTKVRDQNQRHITRPDSHSGEDIKGKKEVTILISSYQKI